MKKTTITHFKAVVNLWYPAVLWSALYIGVHYAPGILSVLCFYEICAACLLIVANLVDAKKMPYVVQPAWSKVLLKANELAFIMMLAAYGCVTTACFVLLGMLCSFILHSNIKDAYEAEQAASA